MKNFVISLAVNNDKRRNHIENEFSKQNVYFEFFDAITPIESAHVISTNKLDVSQILTKGEIACFLSHYVLWTKVINESIKFAAIFEDDIFLGNNSIDFLGSDRWIDPNIDLIKLEKGWQKKICTSLFTTKNIGDRRLYKLMSDHYGTAGYIISNKGARFLIEKYSIINIYKPVDVVIFGNLLSEKTFNVQQLSPAICIQDYVLNSDFKNFHSDLHEDRAQKQISNSPQKLQRSIPYKIKRELLRPFLRVIDLSKYFTKYIIRKLFERTVDFK